VAALPTLIYALIFCAAREPRQMKRLLSPGKLPRDAIAKFGCTRSLFTRARGDAFHLQFISACIDKLAQHNFISSAGNAIACFYC
jgi:hypothetical protein